MKIIKIIVVVFMVSILFMITGVRALPYAGFAEVTIPALGGTYTSSDYLKTTTSNQTIEADGMTTSMKARTHAMLAPSGYSSYVNLAIGSVLNWGSENNSPNQYRLEVKCTSFNLLNEKFWGQWGYNI